MINHIVFYGTLMQKAGGRGVVGRMIEEGQLRFVRDIQFTGKMYSVGGFPAVIMGEEQVQGELYEILDRDVMHRFDGIEGYSGRRDGDLYTRTLISIPGDEEIISWIYTFNQDVTRLDSVESGSWVEHINH